jgi:hypothetical protein
MMARRRMVRSDASLDDNAVEQSAESRGDRTPILKLTFMQVMQPLQLRSVFLTQFKHHHETARSLPLEIPDMAVAAAGLRARALQHRMASTSSELGSLVP